MKIAYLDCYSGISGDMVVGAMIDLGLGLDFFKGELKKLDLDGFSVSARREKRSGIAGTRFIVEQDEKHHPHGRSFKDIERLIKKSRLSDKVKNDAIGIFRIVAEAEAKIHDVSAGDVHFHEVGAVDSIVDIVCAAAGFDRLGVKKICASKVPTGGGSVRCAHGVFPVPAPATVEILKGVPVVKGGVEEEMVTPTGAAVLKYFTSSFGEAPEMKIEKAGYGAGKKDFKEIPNLFRLILGESAAGAVSEERVSIIETNIDDMNPQICEYLSERLFDSGALDVWLTPISMKKMRPAFMLSVMAASGDIDKLSEIIFSETTTLGVRICAAGRITAERRSESLKTPYGNISVKIGSFNGKVISVTPEYEDCKRIAKNNKVPLKDIINSAVILFRSTQNAARRTQHAER